MAYKIGIIGAGMIAEKHLDAMKAEPRVEASWICNRGEDKLQRVKEKYNIPSLTVDYHELIEAPDVDAVLICTPPVLHKEMFIAALEAGKHVFVEKPVAMDRDEVNEMLQAASRHPDLIVSDCSARHSRLQPKFRAVKELIDSGMMGEIYYIHHNMVARNGRPGVEYNPDAKWFLNKALSGGGPLFDWGVYDLSFHLGVLGDAPRLEAIKDVKLKSGLDEFSPGENVFDVEEMCSVLMEFSGGLRYFWERATHANMEVPNETRIYGTRGGLKFGFCSWDPPGIHVYDYDEDGKSRHREIQVESSNLSDDEALMVHFADILDRKATSAMPLELANKHLDIIWKCYEAAR